MDHDYLVVIGNRIKIDMDLGPNGEPFPYVAFQDPQAEPQPKIGNRSNDPKWSGLYIDDIEQLDLFIAGLKAVRSKMKKHLIDQSAD